MKYIVYILFSESIQRYYVGQIDDFSNRLERHNAGRVKSTKYGMPWKLIYNVEVKTRSESMLLESKIKGRGAKRYLEDNQFGV